MNVTPIPAPFPGEHLAGVSPVMTPTPDENWRSRLNFWTGRALTEQALCTEQENRAARLAWRGRLVTSGVVSGLEIAIESRESSNIVDTLSNQYIHIMPGYGIMPTGEDVFIPRPLRVNLDDIPVVYGHKSGVVPKKMSESSTTAEDTLVARKKSFWYNDLNFGGSTMRYHHLNKRYVPWAAVLVARPVQLYTIENRLSKEPCITDPSRYAFLDPRIADVTQLVLVMVQPSLRKDDLLKGQQSNITWRNRVAAKIFELESSRVQRQEIIFRESIETGSHWDTSIVSDDLLPWEYFGVPLGLIGFEPDPDPSKSSLRRIFYDRNSVVRTGGRSRPRLRPALKVNLSIEDNSTSKGAGTPVLWQKRIEQFNEHLSDLLKENIFNFTSDMNDEDVREKCLNLKSHFCMLPPAGLLPRAALDFITTGEDKDADDRASTSWFFPPHYEVRAVPVVTTDVEALIAASAPLQGYDLLKDPPQVERVDILVLVPESQFDPNLLVIEKNDPAFRAEAERIFALRQDWRQRRDYVRGRFDDLSVIVRGGTKRKLVIDVKDADQVENEPTEKLEGFHLPCEIVPPSDNIKGWQYKISFTGKPVLKTFKTLVGSMHIDEEYVPHSIEYKWQLSDGTYIENRFVDFPPIEVADNLIEPGVEPKAVNLHRLFRLDLDDTVLSAIDVNQQLIGVTLTVRGGKASIAYIEAISKSDNSAVRLWTPVFQSTANITIDGGITVAGPRLLAPFESLYKPEPVNGIDFQTLLNSLNPIITELSPQLRAVNNNLTGKIKLVMNDIGLQNLIKVMVDEAGNAENVVSQCYGKIQANMQLLQSVLVGESDAEQALSSPSAGAMSAIRGRAVEKTQLRESMTIEPNWTGIKNLQNPGQLLKYNFKESTLDDTDELRPRLMIFTKRFAYSPAYQAYQVMGAAMVDTIQSLAKLNIGYTDEFIPELRKGLSGNSTSTTPLIVKSTGKINLTIDANRSQFSKGTWVKIISNTNVDKYIEGLIVEYAPKDGSAVVECEHCNGDQNSENRWNIKISGKSVRFNELAAMNRNEILNLKFSDIDEISLQKGTSSGEIVAKGIRRADLLILVLRKVENYIERRRVQIKSAQLALAAARYQIRSVNARMATINGKLSEVRHDLAVAKTLWQEELARVDSINGRRDEIIAKQVKQLAYVRPRTVNLTQFDLPSCEFERTDALAPVPASLQSSIDPPDELENYIQLFRHAPVRWFTSLSAKLKEVNSRERMQRLLEAAQQNAGRLTSTYLKTIDQSSASARVYSSGYTQIEQLRRNVLKCVVAQRGRTWEDLFSLVVEHAALGDIMDGAHGQNSLSREAALELESFGKVAASLHAEFSMVVPGIRMLWVERYSQFDRLAPLRDITTLPKAELLSRTARKRFQAFLNWMFDRIDGKEPAAVSHVNDLVRMCLLLASHAPVNRLVLGHVPHPIAIRPGLLVPVKVAGAGSVKVGMQFQVWSNNSIVARGIVENLRNEDVSVRVEQTHSQLKTIETNMKIQFIPAAVVK